MTRVFVVAVTKNDVQSKSFTITTLICKISLEIIDYRPNSHELGVGIGSHEGSRNAVGRAAAGQHSCYSSGCKFHHSLWEYGLSINYQH